MTATAKRLRTLSTALAVSVLAGCATLQQPVTVESKRDATLPLLRHPEFQAAVKSAPHWVSEALLQITAYEAELAKK